MKRNKKSKTSSNPFNVMNKALEFGQMCVDKVKEGVSNINISTPKINLFNSSISFDETNDYKECFHNINSLESTLEYTKPDFFNWHFLETHIFNVYLQEEDDEENDAPKNYEKTIKLSASQVLLLGKKLGPLGLDISLLDENNNWVELENIFNITKNDILSYEEQGYFHREVKLAFSDMDKIITFVSKEKEALAKEISNSINKIYKTSSQERNSILDMTTSDFEAIENSLTSIKFDLNKSLTKSIVLDLVSVCCDEHLPSDEDDDYEEKEEEILNNESMIISALLEPGKEFDRKVLEKYDLENEVLHELGLFSLSFEYEDGYIDVRAKLSGQKLITKDEAIQKARKKLEESTLNKLETLISCIA